MNRTEHGPEAISRTLSVYVAEEIIGDGVPVEPDENLLADGLVDSLGMLRVVSFIEANYGVKISPDQFVIENFRNIDVIGRYVDSLLKAPGDQ